MKGKIVTYLCCLFLLLVCSSVFSKQKIPPTPKQNDGFPPDQPGLPIDAGISYLFIVGAAYGIYAIRKRVKN